MDVAGITSAIKVSGEALQSFGLDWKHVGLAVGVIVVYMVKHSRYARYAAMLEAVIKGVEEHGDPEVKDAIQVKATAAGLEAGLNEVVKKVTEA